MRVEIPLNMMSDETGTSPAFVTCDAVNGNFVINDGETILEFFNPNAAAASVTLRRADGAANDVLSLAQGRTLVGPLPTGRYNQPLVATTTAPSGFAMGPSMAIPDPASCGRAVWIDAPATMQVRALVVEVTA